MPSTVNHTASTPAHSSLLYGLDIGGTKIEIGVFLNDLTPIDSWRVATPTDNYDDFLTAIVKLVTQANQRFGLTGDVGIGMPGVRDKHGRVKSANVPCATGRYVLDDLQQKLGHPISMGNDCRLFALSECTGESDATQYRRVYGAIIGTGAAGGLCIDGELYNGKGGFAGEYGHIPVSAYLIDKYQLPIRQCGCGLIGCYESYVAGPGLGWLYQHFGGATDDPRQFVKQLNLGDAIAVTTFDCYMDLLGASFSSIILSYDPDVIVIGGGISKIDKVIESLPHYVNQHLFSALECPPITRAKYGDSSGVRGAAILRRQHNESH